MLPLSSRRGLASMLGILSGLAAAPACQGVEAETHGERAQAIVNGSLSESDEQVVALVYQGMQFCTGTVVGRRTVLTAAHCLPPNINLPLFGIEVFFGSDVSGEGTRLRVVDGIANPGWNENVVGGDVGVLALGEDAPVAAMPMAYLDASSGMLGATARAVGYGVTAVEGEGSGKRRSGMLAVERYDDSSIHLDSGPSATCNGDSGGALLFVQDGVEVLGGIHSRSDCGDKIIAERVDVHTMSFVMPFMEEHEGEASCEADGMCAMGCAQADPDCPCIADGMCSDACPHPAADADCSAECPVDGTCDESCSYDYDCTAGETESLCPDGEGGCEETMGCSASGSKGAGWLGLLLLAGVYGMRRRGW